MSRCTEIQGRVSEVRESLVHGILWSSFFVDQYAC